MSPANAATEPFPATSAAWMFLSAGVRRRSPVPFDAIAYSAGGSKSSSSNGSALETKTIVPPSSVTVGPSVLPRPNAVTATGAPPPVATR
jgi:hypothetical protein